MRSFVSFPCSSIFSISNSAKLRNTVRATPLFFPFPFQRSAAHDQNLLTVPAAQVIQKPGYPLAVVCLALPGRIRLAVGCYRGDQADMLLARFLLNDGRQRPGCPCGRRRGAADKGQQVAPRFIDLRNGSFLILGFFLIQHRLLPPLLDLLLVLPAGVPVAGFCRPRGGPSPPLF